MGWTTSFFRRRKEKLILHSFLLCIQSSSNFFSIDNSDKSDTTKQTEERKELLLYFCTLHHISLLYRRIIIKMELTIESQFYGSYWYISDMQSSDSYLFLSAKRRKMKTQFPLTSSEEQSLCPATIEENWGKREEECWLCVRVWRKGTLVRRSFASRRRRMGGGKYDRGKDLELIA